MLSTLRYRAFGRSVIPLTIFSWLFLLSLSWAGKTVGDLSRGEPSYMGRNLPASSYKVFEAKRLAKAKVAWINFDLLREMGVEFPPEGMTPAFEKAVLDAFAYMVPQAADPAEFYTTLIKKFYADRYGGNGLGKNWGSARAGSAGEIQIKGVGLTPLVGDGQDFHHAHGGASMEESIREAIWGEVLHHELPYSGNRVLALIDTGTFTHWGDGGREPRALIIRQDPLRPAHFIPAPFGRGSLRETEMSRVNAALEHIERSLPVPADVPADAPRMQKISRGLVSYAERIARQYAATYTRGFYHGATSPSNIEISGRFIDYGTQTAQPDHGPVQVLPHVAPFGDTQSLKQVLLGEVFYPIHAAFVGADQAALPDLEELRNAFDKSYLAGLREEFLILAGVPPELAPKLATHPEAQAFSDALYALTRLDTTPINIDHDMPARTSRYDLKKILTTITASTSFDVQSVEERLAPHIADALLRTGLARKLASLRKPLLQAAADAGIGPESLQLYMLESARQRNNRLVDLYRSSMRTEDVRLVDAFKVDGNVAPIWNSINRRIQEGFLAPERFAPFQISIQVERDSLDDVEVFRIFDAKKGEYRLKVRSTRDHGMLRVFGNPVSAEELARGFVHYTTDNWATQREVQARRTGGRIEIDVPLGADLKAVEFGLRSEDGHHWWKKDGRNFKMEAAPGGAAVEACIEQLMLLSAP